MKTNENTGAPASAWGGNDEELKLMGAAHDARNAVCILQMCLDLARNAPDDGARKQALAGMASVVPGCLRLLKKIEAIYKTDGAELQASDSHGTLAKVITATVNAFLTVLPANIDMTMKLEPNLWPVAAGICEDAERLLTNLLKNGRDAMMPKGGELVVLLGNLSLGADAAQSVDPAAIPGRYVCLSVSDSGSGIAPEHQEKMFKSAFTTKKEGFGLGLVTVNKLVVAHGGFVTCQSALGKGTQVNLFFPALDGESGSAVTA
jgi:signal transduction histidine kinase